ncbi:hypothetical protein HCZ77_08820 [Limosilactobacillus fermentum]
MNLNQGVNDIARQAIKDAWHNGRTKSYEDLEQKFEGQQSRIDRMNTNRAQAEVMASADHSKVEQLNQVVNKLVAVLNHNSNLLGQLIREEQKPIDIDGRDLARVLREETNSSASQLIAKQVIAYINQSKTEIANDRNEINHLKNDVKQSNDNMTDTLKQFANGILISLTGVVLAVVVPWWPLKVILGLGAFVGGYIYGQN